MLIDSFCGDGPDRRARVRAADGAGALPARERNGRHCVLYPFPCRYGLAHREEVGGGEGEDGARGSDTLTRVRVRTPTFANMPTARPMALGQTFSDVPLIQDSFGPCYSRTDR